MAFSEIYLKSLSYDELRDLQRANGMKFGNEAKGPIATGHAGFDKAANHPVSGHVGTGNVSSGVQTSEFVRAYSATKANGFAFGEGELHKKDAEKWRRRLPVRIYHLLREIAADRKVIVYEFFAPKGKAFQAQGWVITDEFYRTLLVKVSDSAPKGQMVMDEVLPHISWSDRNLSDPLPATEISQICEDMDEAQFRRFVTRLGYACGLDREECKAAGRYFDPDIRFKAWPENDPDVQGLASDSLDELAALIAIRKKLTVDQVIDLREPKGLVEEIAEDSNDL